ncbi:peptide hydrolase [Trypanosoma cruzi]|nr:peptide hydrolase [Trypanosoma cruzi]
MQHWGALSCRCVLEWSKRAASVGSHARTGRRLREPLDRTMREALLAVATRRCARYPPPPAVSFRWFRGTARRGCGAGRSHRQLLDKDCEGASVPVAESIGTARGTHRRMSSRLFPKGICCYRDHGGLLCCFCCWSEARTKETACRPAVDSCAHHWCHAAAALRGVCTAAVYRFAWSARLRCGWDCCPLRR